MALSYSQKKLLIFVAIACLSSTGAEAWSWSWSSGSGYGWGSDGSSSSTSGPGSGSSGSSWSWGSFPGWSWGSSGSNQSSSSSSSDSGGSSWGWGWGSDGSSGSGSGTNPDGSRWSWSWGSNQNDTKSNNMDSNSDSNTETPRNIVVGGSDGWKKGLDYKEWASKNAPFYINDVLVFKYDKSAKRRNNVYLFEDQWSYMNCDINNGKKIGSTKKGSEESFKFKLNKTQPYFFASGEHDGDYCSNHNMKFTVFPVPHRSD